jgi:hypothetical protein
MTVTILSQTQELADGEVLSSFSPAPDGTHLAQQSRTAYSTWD